MILKHGQYWKSVLIFIDVVACFKTPDWLISSDNWTNGYLSFGIFHHVGSLYGVWKIKNSCEITSHYLCNDTAAVIFFTARPGQWFGSKPNENWPESSSF